MFKIPDPELQVDFAGMLADLRGRHLQDALSEAVKGLDVVEIDRELAGLVPKPSLAALAGLGLRGELLFPVPTILTAKPELLAYYRLLYGFSQKEFYTAETGISRFQAMEKRNTVSPRQVAELPELCRALCLSGVKLLDGVGEKRISLALLDDLTLLTLGPQLRGSANVKKGAAGIVKVFDAIQEIVEPFVVSHAPNQIVVRNAAGRRVLIEFAADPDIIIREEMSSDSYRELIAVEVKGGSDFSNIHNRIGEAEKSHQKAKAQGYSECWTVVNVDRIDIALARRESPTTNRFYRISDLVRGTGSEYQDFRSRIVSLTGIPS